MTDVGEQHTRSQSGARWQADGPDGTISVDDPRQPEVRALLERHLTFSLSETPPEHSFALGTDGLTHPSVTFFSYRTGAGQVLGIGALRRLGEADGEVKSMHTAIEARGRGIGRAMLRHIVGVARERGLSRLYLETGTTPGFEPARLMYESEGFAACGPFGGYPVTTDNTFYTLPLG